MGGGGIPHTCVRGAICMSGGTKPYNCVVVAFHMTVYILVLFVQKGILEEDWLGGMGEGNHQCGDGNIQFELSFKMFK